MRFEFTTANRILFGSGAFSEAGGEAAKWGSLALLVTGKTASRADRLTGLLTAQKLACIPFSVPGEPTTSLVKTGVKVARQANCDLVIGFGGGSVLDAAKIIAAMLTNPGELEDYLEIVGGGKPLTHPAAPCIAIPTTAGTGAEVTRNAVLGVPEHRVKVSVRSEFLLPRLAMVDPLLTHSLPPAITASTGMDALTQLLEAFLCVKANPMTDAICREGLIRAGRSLQRVYEDGSNTAAREDMSLASLFGGLALANAGLGAVHGLAGPLGGMFPIPHGVICARLLPLVMEANLKALSHSNPASAALTRYEEVARLLTENPSATAADGLSWIHHLCQTLKIPSLREFGVKPPDFPLVASKARNASSMKGNPVPLSEEELIEILQNA